MKFLLRSFQLLLAILSCASLPFALAQQKRFPTYTGHINDFANVLDQQTKAKLELWLTNFENMTGTQIAVVTVTSLEGRPIEEYANELDRRTRLEVGYGLEGDLPDGLAGEIIRRMRPELQRGQYSEAMTTGVRTLLDTLAEKWNVNIAGIEDRRYAYRAPAQQPIGGDAGSLICLLVGILIFFLLIYALSKAGRRGNGRGGAGRPGAGGLWWLYPIIFNSGGGTFGGGSWGNTGGWGNNGGWSGGGGWGGFGGGSSGGGGASDSW
jgi:uncharacterized protein